MAHSTWRALMKYPDLIPQINGPWEDLMDTIEELLPIQDGGSRTDTLIMWIAQAVQLGLITRREKMDLATYLIHGYGGC